MNQNTKSDKSVKVINAQQESNILGIFRTLHSKVLTALVDVGVKPTFEQEFGKCTNEDYKNLHQQARILVSDARKARWEEEVREIRTGIANVVNGAMEEQRVRKARYDAIQDREFLAPFPTSFTIPFTALASAFAQGTTAEQMVSRCKELGHTVVKSGEAYALRVQFVPAPTSADKSEGETKAA